MRRIELAIGAAVLGLMAAPAFAQSTEGPVAPPNSMNTTGPTTCTTPSDVTCANPQPKSVVAPPSNAVPSEQTPNTVNGMPVTTPAPGSPTAAVAPLEPMPAPAPARQYSSTDTTVQVVTNGPIPDTPANRAKYGKPLSRAGKHSKPAGN
jgi:hypothetical protein